LLRFWAITTIGSISCAAWGQSALRSVAVSPFASDPLTLQLTEHGQKSFVPEAWIKVAYPDLRSQSAAMNLAEETPGDMRLYYRGVPLCDAMLKTRILHGQPVIVGTAPDPGIVAEAVQAQEFVPEFLPSTQALQWVTKHYYAKNLQVVEACWWLDEARWVPVWSLRGQEPDGRFYQYRVGPERVWLREGLFFHATGKVQTYADNVVKTPDLSVFDVLVSGNERLENEFFRVDTNTAESGVQPAQSSTNEFIYEPTHKNFAEASVFYHASDMLKFFQDLGYNWSGTKPLTLRIHRTINGTANNALYQPNDAALSQKPSISIGDGDGRVLKNLPIDADVVSHEFGHHVVFDHVTSTSGESLILHEGLADYFAFAKYNDACLAESICVVGCYSVQTFKCLRTGENSLKYKDADYTSLDAHRKGQLLSGFLWDLHELMDPQVATKTVFRALDLLVSNSDLGQLIHAMMLTDFTDHAGKNACIIYDAAVARGFQSVLTGIDCHTATTVQKPSTIANTEETTSKTTDAETTKETTKEKKGACGGILFVGGSSLPPSGWGTGALLCFLLPLLLVCVLRIYEFLRRRPYPPYSQRFFFRFARRHRSR
jgi:hypothetical protein